MEILKKQVLLAWNEDIMHCRHKSSGSNGQEAACHPVHPKWFEMVETVTTLQVKCRSKPNAYGNVKESNGRLSAVNLVQV